MNTDSPLNIQPLNKYRATMKKEEVAEALGIARHIIAPLSREGLIEPLGHPQKYCVKLYSRDLLAKNLADVDWLNKVVAAIHKHWRIKNARKRAKLAKLNGSQNPAPAK
jgi:predicted xylose isomerase-like sugar epimerase